MLTRQGLHQRFRIVGFLLLFGLLVQASSLFWSHPLAFVLFLSLGCLLVGLGVLLYLYSLVLLKE